MPNRDRIVKALQAEGIDCFLGYPGPIPLYKYPVIKDRLTFGSSGWPFSLSQSNKNYDYSQSICPKAELACSSTVCMWWNEKLSEKNIFEIRDCIKKVMDVYTN